MTSFYSSLLHIYQPPTQDVDVLKRINKECYEPLFSVIEENENAKFSLNVNGVLIEMLLNHGMGETVEKIKNLHQEGKIEILGTAKFHPILPLIPEKEISRQITLNEELNQEVFPGWKPQGFFPPEMAISPEVADLIKLNGYKWVILSGIACPTDWAYNRIYQTPKGLQLFFRDDILSNKIAFKNITPKDFVKSLNSIFLPEEYEKDINEKENNNNRYVISAMDGETFGHHIANYEKTFLDKLLKLCKKEEIKMTFISELDGYFPISEKKINPKSSSWSTTNADLLASVPYPLWKHPDNDVHRYYWKIMKSLHKLIEMADKLDLTQSWDVENHYNTARWFFDRGIYSCPAWWANPLKGMWSPNLIYKGVELLMRAALNAQLALEYAGNEDAESHFDAITYYHGLLLMELYNITKKNVRNR